MSQIMEYELLLDVQIIGKIKHEYASYSCINHGS